jgi:HAD superfamily hydrolase (TIGR01459 family)
MHKKIDIYPTLLNVAAPFKGILLDANGVFWDGDKVGLMPNAKETMERLFEHRKTIGILSNSTQLVSNGIDKFKSQGLIEGVHFHFLLTSGEITRQMFLEERLPFKTPKKRFFLFGTAHPKFSSHELIFKDTSYIETKDIKEADFIYISIPHIDGQDQTKTDLFLEDVKKLKGSKIPMVCANPDKFAHEGKPSREVVRQGSIASMYEEMGGKVFYTGKPSSVVFSKAMNFFYRKKILHPEEILMVGDTPETDIRGARNFGMASALVTTTGIMGKRMQNGMDAISKLPKEDLPDFFIERF